MKTCKTIVGVDTAKRVFQFTHSQLQSIRVRVEDAVSFLENIVSGDAFQSHSSTQAAPSISCVPCSPLFDSRAQSDVGLCHLRDGDSLRRSE